MYRKRLITKNILNLPNCWFLLCGTRSNCIYKKFFNVFFGHSLRNIVYNQPCPRDTEVRRLKLSHLIFVQPTIHNRKDFLHQVVLEILYISNKGCKKCK